VAPKSIQNHPKLEFGTVVRTVKIWFKTFAVPGQISGAKLEYDSRQVAVRSVAAPRCLPQRPSGTRPDPVSATLSGLDPNALPFSAH
jgi:hypothetical protein